MKGPSASRWGPHVSLFVSTESGMAGSRIFLGGGTLVGRVAEPLPTPVTHRGHTVQLACGSEAGRALFPFGERKKTQLYLHVSKDCKAISISF